MDEEISKEEFKRLYFLHAKPNSGWTADYWDHFFEKQEGKKYFFTRPVLERMFISSGKSDHRIFFLTEEAEESFFDFPGKE